MKGSAIKDRPALRDIKINYKRGGLNMSNEQLGNNWKFLNEPRGNHEKISIEARAKQEKISNEQLVARIQAGEDTDDNMLMLYEQNRGFITTLAKRFQGYAEMDDLKQEGYLALCDAVRHYDAGQGVPFINYAAFWIKQGMQRYIENCGAVVRIPSGVQQLTRKYKKIASEYQKYYGHEASDREMKAFLGVSTGELENIKKSAKMGQISSLNVPIAGEDGDLSLVDIVASEEVLDEDCIKRIDMETMKRELWLAVDNLPDNQPEIIRSRYIDGKTLREIGEMNGVSMSMARQMESKAIRALRLPRRCQKFRGYYEEYMQAACYRHVGLESFQRTWTSEVEREVLGYKC